MENILSRPIIKRIMFMEESNIDWGELMGVIDEKKLERERILDNEADELRGIEKYQKQKAEVRPVEDKTISIDSVAPNGDWGYLKKVQFEERDGDIYLMGKIGNSIKTEIITDGIYDFLTGQEDGVPEEEVSLLKKLWKKYSGNSLIIKEAGKTVAKKRRQKDENGTYVSKAKIAIPDSKKGKKAVKTSSRTKKTKKADEGSSDYQDYEEPDQEWMDGHGIQKLKKVDFIKVLSEKKLMTYLGAYSVGNHNTLQPILNTLNDMFQRERISTKQIKKLAKTYGLPM